MIGLHQIGKLLPETSLDKLSDVFQLYIVVNLKKRVSVFIKAMYFA